MDNNATENRKKQGPSGWAIALASYAWTGETTADIEMDHRLAYEFAHLLDIQAEVLLTAATRARHMGMPVPSVGISAEAGKIYHQRRGYDPDSVMAPDPAKINRVVTAVLQAERELAIRQEQPKAVEVTDALAAKLGEHMAKVMANLLDNYAATVGQDKDKLAAEVAKAQTLTYEAYQERVAQFQGLDTFQSAGLFADMLGVCIAVYLAARPGTVIRRIDYYAYNSKQLEALPNGDTHRGTVTVDLSINAGDANMEYEATKLVRFL